MEFINYDNESVSIHFETDNGQHYIDAFVEATCSTAFLEFAKNLAKIYNYEIRFEVVALKEGGVIKDFQILWKEKSVKQAFYSTLITILLLNPLSHLGEKWIDSIFEDKELTELQKEALKLEIEQRKLEIEGNYALIKKQSDFYKAALKDQSIAGISFISSQNNKTHNSSTVKRSEFENYILESNVLDPEEIEDSIIVIDSPVLTDKKYKWKGTYNGNPITFNITDNEFLVKVRSGIYSFKSGMVIKCNLHYKRILNEEGEIKNSEYVVKEVYELIEGEQVTKTDKGNKRDFKKKQDVSPNLFTILEDENHKNNV